MKNRMTPCDLRHTVDSPVDGIVVLDTETTGLTPGKDEVLSIAIVNADGERLFYSLIKPLNRKRWPSATEIHGITWADVKDKPTIYDVGNEVADILESASLIVGYNVEFDMEMLEENGCPSIRTERYDLMAEYAKAYGRWSDRKADYLWCKLDQCARHYKYSFVAHNALEDAKATAYCYGLFRKECAEELPEAIKEEERLREVQAEREAEAIKEEERLREVQAEREAEAIKEEERLREENERIRKENLWKKIAVKSAAIIGVLLSIALFMNSCSLAGGDILGTIFIAIIAVIAFFVGITYTFMGDV